MNTTQKLTSKIQNRKTTCPSYEKETIKKLLFLSYFKIFSELSPSFAVQ